jgi:hypothetical protein
MTPIHIPDKERKTKYIMVRVTPSEKTEIEEAAKKANAQSVSEYLLYLHRNA